MLLIFLEWRCLQSLVLTVPAPHTPTPRPPRDLRLPRPPLVPAKRFNHLAESTKARVSTGTIFRDALLRSLAHDIEN